MTDEVLYTLVCKVYAVFGRPVPMLEDPIVLAVAEAVRDIPDAAADAVLARIRDRDDMPHNLGRAMRFAWDAVKAEKRACRPRPPCRACSGRD